MRHRISTPYIVLPGLALAVLVLVWASLVALPDPAAASPPAQDVSKCIGVGNVAASPDQTECDPIDLEVTGAPLCESCRAGLRVVFVQRDQATNARWQNTEAAAVLAGLDKLYDGDLQAAVVQYGPNGVRTPQRMTPDLDRVRSALQKPTTVSNPPDSNYMAHPAAREALSLLRNPSGCIDCPCRMVIFFGQDPPTPG